MIYAIKAIDGKEINKKITDWNVCKSLVLGHKAIYKSFENNQEHEADQYLINTPIQSDSLGEGYAPVSMDIHLIYGKFLFNRFHSENYEVSVYKTSKGKVACKGASLPDNEHLLYAMSGYFEQHSKYGYQFIVTSYKEHITDSKDSIINYLSCGLLKGIGPKTAEAIYSMFGGNTMEVLDKHPERLLKIKGISQNKLKAIKESYQESKSSQEIVSYLLSFGISQKYGVRLYQQYKTQAMAKLRENPYILCMQRGLTFLDADRVAKKENFPLKSSIRFEYACRYVIKKNEDLGDTGIELQKFGNALLNLLGEDGYTKQEINEKVLNLVRCGSLKVLRLPNLTGQYIFTDQNYRKEYDLATMMLQVKAPVCKKELALKAIRECEATDKMILDEIQEKAIMASVQTSLSIIEGAPGTGKTTTIRRLEAVHKKLYPDMKIIFLAPTGRAARRITETTGEEAHTIHSYLRLTRDYVIDENEVLIQNALIVIDEFSMVDIYVAYLLFHAISNNCRVVIVGDTDQLPSIGPGTVLRDMIESRAFPVTTLSKIYRTGEDTQICANAHRIKNGDPNIQQSSDYKIFDCNSMEDVKNVMAERVIELTKKYGIGKVMCLCPYWEHTAGINEMNALLQARLNPASADKNEIKRKGIVLREGDFVMQTKVNTEEASNGDIGFITQIITDDDGNATVRTNINQREIDYENEDIDLLIHAYATSVHKAQGSEMPACVFTLMPFHKGMLYYNIPYVAGSRGKYEVDFCGSRDAMKQAILNREKCMRITSLKYFLIRESGQFINIA